MSVGLAFIPIIGWIAMGFTAAQAADLRAAYNQVNEQIENLKEDKAEEANLIETVNKMLTAFDDLDAKMEAAIAAMKELGELFSEQSACYGRIFLYINAMQMGVSSENRKNRQLYISTHITKTVEKLKELRELADEFSKSILHQVTIAE